MTNESEKLPPSDSPHSTEEDSEQHFFRASATDFKKIPGSPIAYWASERILNLFQKNVSLSDKIDTREGLTTGSNDLFLRLWHEVQITKIGFGIEDNNEAQKSQKRYFAYAKGGNFRRWSGNFEYIVNWFNDGEEVKVFKDAKTGRVRSHNYNGNYAFRTGFTWSGISSGVFAVRHVPPCFMFDAKGPMGFSKEVSEQPLYEAFLNSAVTNHLIKMLAPTLDFKLGHILNLPVAEEAPQGICHISKSAVRLSSSDWDSYETSWDFTALPLLQSDYRHASLQASYQQLRAHWLEMTLEMQRLEEENNRIFIEAYGLQDELTPEIPLKEITLTCNPHYRYGVEECEVGSKKWKDLQARLLQDTMKELASYAVGCMFGRYSLDKPGLILANQGETIEDYYKKLLTARTASDAKENQDNNFRDFSAFRGSISFPADEDNVIPILDEDWFADDISERFKKFLKVAFGEGRYEENLRFIEMALGKNGKARSIRDYFLKDFYADHVQRYKKRPIYWLFSSPKGSFNALIYMHRYRPDTVSLVLNEYLREFRTKLNSQKNHFEALSISASASQSEKTKALKEMEKIRKMITELEEYEREELYPLATRQLAIDLDDGVKVNYPKFGAALKKIPGLAAKEED